MIGTQITVALAVALGAAALFALIRAESFETAMRALEAPSNADIYPLENRMLAYFAAAPILGVLALGFAGSAARRVNRFRSFVFSLALWSGVVVWMLAVQVSRQISSNVPSESFTSLMGAWLFLPPLGAALGLWLIARAERKGEIQ